jgi:hypothetical protein
VSGKAILHYARNGHGKIGVLLYELVAQTVGLRMVTPSRKLAHKQFHSGSRKVFTDPGTWTVRSTSVSLDFEAEKVSTGALVVVKEFTLNRCPFQ